MTDPAYQLLWGTNHLLGTDELYDLMLEQTEAFAPLGVWTAHTNLPANLPEPIIMSASFGTVGYTHYPSNDQQWPIMSRRMLDLLLAVRAFPHVAIPLAIIDPILRRDEPDPSEDFVERRLETADRDYVIVHLTEHLDILDEERSEMRRSRAIEGLVTISEYALHVPADGLPPFFRLSIQPTQLFISADARQALAAAGMAGPVYLPLVGYQNGTGDETDVPVPVPQVPEGA
ncbi:hypothetical protein [Deinococcus arcticus]|uniref:Uncharacterized protein n=1 Tax=Deinococcus arcticus TaxID=2136176 RepID=A0A2T3W3B5_9DEIO|nr:hypothetical protein [Deinococcus arcticus]PTA66388.1 hypothetical protein C8263_18290 [Deinococcus arcticus]